MFLGEVNGRVRIFPGGRSSHRGKGARGAILSYRLCRLIRFDAVAFSFFRQINNFLDFLWLSLLLRGFRRKFKPISLQTRGNLILFTADRSRLISLVSGPRGNPSDPGFCSAAKVKLLHVVVALNKQVLEGVA